MFRKHETEVLIVGAGPVGLFTALSLSERGVQFQIVDRDRRTAAHSYALVLHGESLRLLDEVGLARELVDRGHRMGRVELYEGAELRADLDFSKLGGKFPFVLVLPQSDLESALEERLRKRRVEILWNHRLQELKTEESGVLAEIAKLDRVASGYPIAQMEWVVTKSFSTKASFVVGADGYHSLVRRKLGLEQTDLGGGQVFSVFEFGSSIPLPDDARVVLRPDSISVYWPLGERRSRWSFEIADASQHDPTEERLRKLLRERAPWFGDVPMEITWSSVVQFERRLASRFGRGNIWIAGDAAHLTGPVGAQSMNVGLREARDLAAAVFETLRGQAPPDRMEAYNNEREREWRMLLGLSPKLGPLPGADAWVRREAARLLPCIPASGKDLETMLQGIGLAPAVQG